MTDNPQAAQFQRKTIIIKKRLQYHYMALIVTSVLLAFIVFGLDALWTVSKVVNDNPYLMPLLDIIKRMAPLYAIKMALFMCVVLIVSAVISHRMAGPIYKFEKSCSVVAGGDLTHRVYLRKGDQLMDLQECFNNMAAAMHETAREYEKFRAEAAAAGLAEKAEALGVKIREIMPKFKV
jgi:methyl-accepting chemotaxis protein